MKATAPFLLFWLLSLFASVDARAQDVTVTLMNGSTESGSLEALTDAAIVLRGQPQPFGRPGRIPGTEKVIPLTTVMTIERRSRAIPNGVLIGAGAGIVSSLVLSANVAFDEDRFIVTGLFTGIGAGVGLAVGAIYSASDRDGKLLYSAPHSGTVRLRPVITRQRRGVQLALAWGGAL